MPGGTHTHETTSHQDTHTIAVDPNTIPTAETSESNEIIWVKPFDRFRIKGGGAAGDIFRRFKICQSEEQDFVLHWCRNHIALGILTRDDNGVLEFRISSSDLSDLTEMGIGRPNLNPETGIHWTHIYDEQGVSWLTQFRFSDHIKEIPSSIDIHGKPVVNFGRIGRYGPSGLTPSDFYHRMEVKLGMGRISMLKDVDAGK